MKCPACERQRRLVGRAMTQWSCAICNRSSLHTDTLPPKVCAPCSIAHGRCESCGKPYGKRGEVTP